WGAGRAVVVLPALAVDDLEAVDGVEHARPAGVGRGARTDVGPELERLGRVAAPHRRLGDADDARRPRVDAHRVAAFGGRPAERGTLSLGSLAFGSLTGSP